LDKNWLRYEAIKVCDLYLAYWHLFSIIYICTPSEWHFFLILMHPSACHLGENWARYKIIIMTSWYNGNWYLCAIVCIYVHHLNGIFLLILMHLNICYLDENWVRYEAIIVTSRYSNKLLASNLFPFSEIEWMPHISLSFNPNNICLGALKSEKKCHSDGVYKCIQ